VVGFLLVLVQAVLGLIRLAVVVDWLIHCCLNGVGSGPVSRGFFLCSCSVGGVEKTAKIARRGAGSSRPCPALERPLWSVYGSCRPGSMPRPGSESRNKARLACPSDAARGGGLLLGSCSGPAGCGGPAMTMSMGPRRCTHWMVLLFCTLLLAFPSHGTDTLFLIEISVVVLINHGSSPVV
jgi:hypothetical protein